MLMRNVCITFNHCIQQPNSGITIDYTLFSYTVNKSDPSLLLKTPDYTNGKDEVQ
jgi:hypothetical protein